MLRSLVLVGFLTASASADVLVYESKEDHSITEGEIVVEADPDVAYDTAIDYMKWPAIFPDIKKVIVTTKKGDDAKVTFVHTDGNKDNVHFHNTPIARMVWFEDTGGTAEVWAEIVFVPGDKQGTTRVHSRVYASVHGVTGLFVSSDKVKNLRSQRVRSDLQNLRSYFSKH